MGLSTEVMTKCFLLNAHLDLERAFQADSLQECLRQQTPWYLPLAFWHGLAILVQVCNGDLFVPPYMPGGYELPIGEG